MAKATLTQEGWIMFECPACECCHGVPVPPQPNAWEFNGDLDAPTLSPSLRVTYTGSKRPAVCHFFVRDGMIEFCGDSTHALAGQTVSLPEWK